MFTLIPKNSGLTEYKDKALDQFPFLRNGEKSIKVRGEDIPSWIDSFVKNGRNAFGITGEDLYRDYLVKNPMTKVKIVKKLEWKDNNALFGKPALCLMSDKNLDTNWKKDLTISIPTKYANLVNQYLSRYEELGYNFNKLYFNGSLEVSSFENIADLIVDIVYTGSSMKQYNLKILDVVMTSDIVIIGGEVDD